MVTGGAWPFLLPTLERSLIDFQFDGALGSVQKSFTMSFSMSNRLVIAISKSRPKSSRSRVDRVLFL
jgi:hypothetical protein